MYVTEKTVITEYYRNSYFFKKSCIYRNQDILVLLGQNTEDKW